MQSGVAKFIGSPDVCDYLDFVVAPGSERNFFESLLDDLKQQGVSQLDLAHVRPDSMALTHLKPVAEERGCGVISEEDDVSLELDLPSTWEDYMAVLDTKQRHELKRKLRRLDEAGDVDYLCQHVKGDTRNKMDSFFNLFATSQEKKAHFMTSRMESFFRYLAEAMAEIGLLQFGMLKVDGDLAAMTMGFDYNGAVYLYNSAYNPQYRSLSVGLLSKALCIKESIRRGRKKWDFLKGRETYKYRLGGKDIPLYRCQIEIS
jgi:CelD/BcsL family acetyltransferase involved in cellulose biosynthesis